MSAHSTNQTKKSREKLLSILINAGGIKANKEALHDLQSFFSAEIPKPNIEQLKKDRLV